MAEPGYSMAKVRVGVNGYGTIGKRVATAIAKQDDMELVGVTKTRPNYEALDALSKGYGLYIPEESVEAFEKAGVKYSGTIKDMLGKVDIVVDCTPGNVGEYYRDMYKAAGVKAIFQGGEEHSLTGISFNSTANYAESWGAPMSRVVSCNTTALLRTLYPIDKALRIKNAYVTIVRRAADPGDSKGHHGREGLHNAHARADRGCPALPADHHRGGPGHPEAGPQGQAREELGRHQVHPADHGAGPRPRPRPLRHVRDRRLGGRRQGRRRHAVLLPGGPPGVRRRAGERGLHQVHV